MNAQPANRGTRNTAFAVRFVLWLFAALSLADFPPAIAETSRFAKSGLVKGDSVGTVGDARAPVEVAASILTDSDPLPDPGLAGSDPALDAVDGSASGRLIPRGRTAAPAGIAAAQCPDGQPFAAFNSRAPPMLG